MRKNLLLHRFALFSYSLLACSVCFAQVTEAWVARYNGPGRIPDRNLDIATDMAVDASGNVYVTGRSRDTETFLDYATIKFNASGGEQWVRRYSGGPDVTLNAARAITVDGSGNVYVTGESNQGTAGEGYDYVTIKYDADGNELWIRRYDGQKNDHAHAIVVDDFGNVYVTGQSQQNTIPAAPHDYATVKYDADGNEQWVRRYNGPADADDKAYSMIIDASGNICITGESEGIGTPNDIATVKYDTDGNELWVARYRNAGAGNGDLGRRIATDANENIYVTGYTLGGASVNYITIKYSHGGAEIWAKIYDGLAGGHDQANGIAVDASGDVYVTGYESGDFATIKYNNEGVELWVTRYDGPAGSNDGARSVAVDAFGNVYVLGVSNGIGTEGDYATIKYNRDGMEQWVARYTGPDIEGDTEFEDRVEYPISLRVDAAANVYVTGASDGSGTRLDYATIKYVQTSSLIVAAGLDLTIFQGYGSLCVTLSAKASGGLPPYEYSWIPGQFTTQNIQVCPTKTISYAVTAIDAGKNKAMDEVKVNVIDVRCGKKLDMVLVCHKGKKELCLSKDEVKEHLAHGDVLGACKAPPGLSDNPAISGISKLNLDPPSKFRVANYPNPVSSITRIQYEIPFDGRVAIKVYDVLGRVVATLVNGNKKAGFHKTNFDASSLQKGVYYYKVSLEAGEKIITQSGKMIVIK